MLRFLKRLAADVPTPAVDKVTLFVDTTGAAKLKNEAGTVTSVGGGISEALIDAAGDLIVGTAADTAGRLAKGAALQVLRVNAGATALEYADPSGSGSTSATRAYRATSNQTLTTATHTGVQLNAEEFDDDGLHDNATQNTRFTIGTTTRYEITGQVYFALNATGARFAILWKNGVGTGTRIGQAFIPANATHPVRIQVTSGVVALTAGDYIELGAYQDSGGNLDLTFGAENIWLSSKRVS